MQVCGEDIKVEGRLLRIARIDGEKYQFPEDPDAVLDGLRKSGRRIDLFTFMQRLPGTPPKYGYPMELDNLAVLPVTNFETWWTQQLDNKTRNMIRKAEKKGVETREIPLDDDLVRGIWEIYNECPIRQGKPFPHYGMELAAVHQYAGTFLDSSFFIGAFVGGKLIGFIKLTMDQSRRQAGMMHIISMVQHRDKAPTNALITQAVRSCAERGITYLVYSNFSIGKKQRDSLSDFKENSGFQKMCVPRYYVPLTPLGWAAFRLGLHHRLMDRVPEPILGRLREVRKAWHNRRFRPVAEVR